MATYLLLRSNKQSGPYSLDDLVNMGLKPYDLVWVEGKSAAWRYPSEVLELKPYAPAVEEQPYDRFFKKPQKDNGEKPVEEKVSFSAETAVSNFPVSYPAREESHSVFVSLPGTEKHNGKMIAVKAQPQSKPVEKLHEQPPPVEKNTQPPKEKPQGEVVIETKYEQSLEEMKDLYRQTMLERKKRTEVKRSTKKILKSAAVFAYVLALGLLIGLTIMQKKNNSPSAANGENQETQINNESSESGTGQSDLSLSQPSGVVNSSEEPLLQNDEDKNRLSENNNQSVGAEKKPEEQTSRAKEIISEEQAQKSVINSDTGERVKTSREENSDAESEAKNIMEMVSVQANDYKRGAFGGIKDLQLTVTNQSGYILDKVVVELQYLKPSELPLKTETVEFKSVAPKGTMTIKIPDNNRGIKVLYKIISVKSSEYDNVVAGL